MIGVRKMCHRSFHLKFPLTQISFRGEKSKKIPLWLEWCVWTQNRVPYGPSQALQGKYDLALYAISFTSNSKFTELKEFEFIMCLNSTTYITCPDPKLSLWGLMLIHIIKSNIKLFYLLMIRGWGGSRMCMVVCWTQLVGGCCSKVGRGLIHSQQAEPLKKLIMPYYVGKHRSRVTGAATTQVLRRKVTEKEAEKQSHPGDGGFLSKGDARCFYSAQGNTISWSKLLRIRGFNKYTCLVPFFCCNGEALNISQKEKGACWWNDLPLGTKSQELPGTRGLTWGGTVSWNKLQEQTETTGSADF